MTCKRCGHVGSHVIESRPRLWDGVVVTRRARRCDSCKHRWYSLEIQEDDLDAYCTSQTLPLPKKGKASDKPAWMRSQESSRRRLLGFKDGGEPDPEYSDLAEVQVRNYWEERA